MDISTRLQTTADFHDDLMWITRMFQNGITFDSLEDVASERKCFGIADDTYALQWKKVNIDVPVNIVSTTTNIKIPTP